MGLFHALVNQMDAVESEAQLRFSHAVAHGAAMALGGNNSEVKSFTSALVKRAFPARWVEVTEG